MWEAGRPHTPALSGHKKAGTVVPIREAGRIVTMPRKETGFGPIEVEATTNARYSVAF